MGSIRTLLGERYRFAVLLVVLALAAKALVPAGFMIGIEAKVLTVQICADAQGASFTRQIVVPQRPHGDDGGAAHGKADTPCAWSALSLDAASGTDAALLALALAFIVAVALWSATSAPPARTTYLRPPLRGPPPLI
ncbi:MAG TPA: hypothetical protein VF440_02680 [Novosphingobium sp.]